MTGSSSGFPQTSKNNEAEGGEDDEPMDIEDYDESKSNILLEDQDDSMLTENSTSAEGKGGKDNNGGDAGLILKTRTYDLSITYDKFYQTPRVWLFGYDEQGKPLTGKQILEDIYADYSLKTVTLLEHPHLSSQHASIHPCKHAEVMKKMIDRIQSEGHYIRVDLYLYLFLKFISAVIPTIEYDFSMAFDMK